MVTWSKCGGPTPWPSEGRRTAVSQGTEAVIFLQPWHTHSAGHILANASWMGPRRGPSEPLQYVSGQHNLLLGSSEKPCTVPRGWENSLTTCTAITLRSEGQVYCFEEISK